MTLPPSHGSAGGPAADCARCPRLAGFRAGNRRRHPGFFNGPVPSFGATDAALLIVGLAPGLKGANRTGRPFTGDDAGDLLYATLARYGFTAGSYGRQASDGLRLIGCRIANAVRCVPPENRPTAAEIRTCLPFLDEEVTRNPNLRVVVALGTVAHNAVLAALGARRAAHPFAHGAEHAPSPGIALVDSYHCSRYNTNTGRLTEAMFHAVFDRVRRLLDRGAVPA